MHRGHNKILIYTIFVLPLTRWTTSTPPPQSDNYEEKLAREVISYHQFINPVNSFTNAFTDDATSGWITQEVLRSLQYNVSFVLKLMSAYYQLTKYNWEFAGGNVDRKMEVRRVVPVTQLPFEAVVCSLVPRLLAFLYISINDPSVYIQLHRLHSVLCLMMPTMENQSNPEYLNQSTYLCDAKTIMALFDLKRELKHYQTTTTTSIADHQIIGATFVRKALELADGVDLKNRVLTSLSLYSEDSWRNVFGVTVVDLYRERTDGKLANRMNEKNVSKLYFKLRQLSFKYVANSEMLEQMTVPDMVIWSMAHAFKTLVTHFGRVVREQFNENNSLLDRRAVDNVLSNASDGLCHSIPLVLAFLAANCSDAANHAVPFGLYLTLCGDWHGFLEVQCPRTLDQADEHTCLENAIANRLLVNFYRITGSFPGYDDDIDDVKDTRYSALHYVDAVYIDLCKYYVELDKEFLVWTASDWLTGKHFLVNRRQDPGRVALAMGEQTIMLSGNGGRLATEVLLSEAHKLLLPWHSDPHNVFAFHATLFSRVDQMMNEFVHRHTSIISLYLQYINGSLGMILSFPLYHTFGWYEECARMFHHYLDMPGPREPRGEWSVDDLLFANENLMRTANENFVGRNTNINLLSEEKIAEMAAWTEREFSSIEGLGILDKLKLTLKNNCVNAVEYLNDFIRIARGSIVTGIKAQYLQVDTCEQFIYGILATSDLR